MSTTQLDDLYTEAGEYDDSDLYEDLQEGDLDSEDESYDDSEDEESRVSRRRRARARRLALARRRQAAARARARARTPGGGAPAPQSTTAAIRSVDLESKVAYDGLRRELAAQRNRSSRSEYAAVAGVAVNQLVESFRPTDNAYLKAALRFAPLLLLSPQRRGQGIQAFITDPRVLGGVAVLGLTFFGQRREQASIEVASPSQLTAKSSAKFVAQVLSNGKVLTGRTVKWDTTDSNVATVDDQGNVTGKNAGGVFILAKVEGMPDKRVPLTVT